MRKIDEKNYNIEEIKAYKNKYIEISTEDTIEKLSKFIVNLL